MVAIRENKETTKLWHPLRLTCKVVVESQLVDLCHRAGDKPHKGTPLGKLPELYPHDMLKRRLMTEARMFTRAMRSMGYEPVRPDGEAEYRVWGPWMEKVDTRSLSTWTPEEGNPLVPNPRQALKVWGYQGNEYRDDKGLVYRIQGLFTASYGFEEESTGVLIV